MSKNRRSRREWQRKKNQGLKRGTFKHRPTVRIPDPTYDSLFSKEKDCPAGIGFPTKEKLELWYGGGKDAEH